MAGPGMGGAYAVGDVGGGGGAPAWPGMVWPAGAGDDRGSGGTMACGPGGAAGGATGGAAGATGVTGASGMKMVDSGGGAW